MGFFTDWGSTAEERARTYPCDRHLPGATAAFYRAVDIAAPPALVYSWLCQLRVAPYSYDWLDNRGRQSPRTRDPANERLAVGDPIMNIFRLAEIERDRHLTMVLTRTGLFGEVVVTYQVDPAPSGSRLFVKVAVQPRYHLLHALLVVGDLVMMRKQLLTFKELAERDAGAAPRLG
jgi:hypothetical protein